MNVFRINLRKIFVLVFVFTGLVSIGHSQSYRTESLIVSSSSSDQVSNLSVASVTFRSQSSTVWTTADPDSDLWKTCPVEKWAEEYDDKWVEKYDRNPPQPQISKECLAEMGKHLQKHPRTLGHNWLTQLILLESPMTYHRIFEDPDGDRASIIDSLSRPECRFQEGDLVQWDLKDSCHANAFANYATYLTTCASQTYLDRFHNPQWEPDLSDTSDYTDSAWKNNEVRKVVFQLNVESYWVLDRCRNSGLENHWFNSKNEDEELLQLLNVVASNIGEKRLRRPSSLLRHDVVNLLVAIAAKLGDEWATLEYRGNIRLHPDPWHDKIEKLQPWRRQQYLQYWNKPPTVKRVKDSINLIHAIEDANRRVNWEYFVTNLCYYNSDNVKHMCQQSIETLRQTELNPRKDERAIKTLSQIEQTARKLGVFSNLTTSSRELRNLYEDALIFRVREE